MKAIELHMAFVDNEFTTDLLDEIEDCLYVRCEWDRDGKEWIAYEIIDEHPDKNTVEKVINDYGNFIDYFWVKITDLDGREKPLLIEQNHTDEPS